MVLDGWWVPLEEGHRESGCWESVALRRVGRAGGLGALTVDLHVEGQAGAARRIAGGAAVVAAVGRAQGLQLEESALLGELGVGICLERPPTRWQTLISGGLDLASPPGGPVMEPVGLALHWCPTEDSGETDSFGREGRPPWSSAFGPIAGRSGSEQELEPPSDLQSLNPQPQMGLISGVSTENLRNGPQATQS